MIRASLPWLLSAITFAVMWLAGNKDWHGWLLGLAGQTVWITFAIWYEAWGLLPLTVVLIGVYTRNLVKWRRGEVAQSLEQARYDAWGEAYGQGVADEQQSQDFDGGRTPPGRINPYGVGKYGQERPR